MILDLSLPEQPQWACEARTREGDLAECSLSDLVGFPRFGTDWTEGKPMEEGGFFAAKIRFLSPAFAQAVLYVLAEDLP